MLNLNINSTGLVFSVNIDGHDIHFKEWMATDDCIYYLPLATLVDNGCATFYKHECTVPYEKSICWMKMIKHCLVFQNPITKP